MDDSILLSVKKAIGADACEYFDSDIIMHINSVFSILNQIGVGPLEGFSITDKSAVWESFIPKNSKLEFVKSYMFLKVKLLFDPPLSSAVIDNMKTMADQLEWRINMAAEFDDKREEEIQNGK